MLGWGRSSSRAARVTHSMSSVFHYSREKPKPSNQNKTRTMKSTGEEGSPTRESLVCGICLAKAFYRQGHQRDWGICPGEVWDLVEGSEQIKFSMWQRGGVRWSLGALPAQTIVGFCVSVPPGLSPAKTCHRWRLPVV